MARFGIILAAVTLLVAVTNSGGIDLTAQEPAADHSLQFLPAHIPSEWPARTRNSAAHGKSSTAVAYPTADPDDCLVCHDDESLTMLRNGKEVSLYVSPDLFHASPHGTVDCIDCHQGFDPDEEPHRDDMQPVDCAPCHASAAASLRRGRHAAGLSCATCHSNVHTTTGSRATVSGCNNCHDEAAAGLRESVHAAKDGPTCLSCHDAHRVSTASTATCLSCHAEREFMADRAGATSVEAVLAYTKSIHGEVTECSDCHASHRVFETTNPASPVSREGVAATCAQCHEDVSGVYLRSEHGKALAADFETAPACTDCHGEHDITRITDSESPVSREHEVAVCESCHLNSPEVVGRMTHTAGFVASYDRSVHGVAAAAGNTDAAVCSDCHGAHQAMKASSPESSTNRFNIAATCAKCHDEVSQVFVESTHGEALVQGVADAPTCTTCHSEHAIVEHTRPESPVAALNVSAQVCSPCHDSYKLSAKYGFPSDRPASFGDSYHGLAGRFGSVEAANCTSCHGVHDIWPSTDARSRVHPANLVETCGECHPGANPNFAKGSVHVIRTRQGDQLLYWISTIYILVIAVTISAMSVHNILDWWRKTWNRYQERLATVPPRAKKTGLYIRMTLNERIQHALLAGSFILLVITGFMLKFPDAWWVRGLRSVMGAGLFDLRGLVHRIAAVVMVGDALYHIYYVAFTTRGRQFIRDILFRVQDARDFLQMVKYNLGISDQRPRFDRFGYVEKAEYWALIWGTIVMTITGIVLWFENRFMGAFSKLFVDVNEVIHYYEAWLAFLAIVVWHIYYVVFNPDVYPMNFTWLTGKITEEEMEHEHPLELERLKPAEREPHDGQDAGASGSRRVSRE